MKYILLAAGLALLVGVEATGASDAFPQRARVKFQGNFDVRVSTPPRTPRRLDAREVASALSTAKGQSLAGTLILDGTFEGPAVTLRATGTGGVKPARLTGTRRNGQCSLITDDGSTRYDGPCGPQGFSGRISSTEAIRDTVSGSFSTSAVSVVDIAAEEETRRKQAELATARRKAEADLAAKEAADLKAKASKGDVAAMLAMADRYESGRGVPQSGDNAVAMLVAASKKGSSVAAKRLEQDYDLDRTGKAIPEVAAGGPTDGSESCQFATNSYHKEPSDYQRWKNEMTESPNISTEYVNIYNRCKRPIWYAISSCSINYKSGGIIIAPGETQYIRGSYEYCGYRK